MVIGGGIAGITAGVEAGEAGRDVVLVESGSHLGGRVARLHRYFPKLCPPWCGLEIDLQRIGKSRRIRVMTGTEVAAVKPASSGYSVDLVTGPSMITSACTSCGECAKACPVERESGFDLGMSRTRAAYLPYPMAFPARHAIDAAACKGRECGKCVPACRYGAIDLDAKPARETIEVSSIVIATGWRPYDASRIEGLGFGRIPDVITNVMMERLASPFGPTGGKIVRPSDGKEARRVAFVQCAGSRDVNHLAYCSSVCCMASLKQAWYVREAIPSSEVEIFCIDLRAIGRHEDFLARVRADPGVRITHGKVAEICEDSATGAVVVSAEDADAGRIVRKEFDLAVLATGMVPNPVPPALAHLVKVDDHGFASGQGGVAVFAAGVSSGPMDVASSVEDATCAALLAMTGG